jgi:hypothetical protein
MSRTRLLTMPVRAVAVSPALFAVLVVAPPTAEHALEPRPPVQATTSSASWAEADAALGGTSLAVYVAHHHQRTLGPIGV